MPRSAIMRSPGSPARRDAAEYAAAVPGWDPTTFFGAHSAASPPTEAGASGPPSTRPASGWRVAPGWYESDHPGRRTPARPSTRRRRPRPRAPPQPSAAGAGARHGRRHAARAAPHDRVLGETAGSLVLLLRANRAARGRRVAGAVSHATAAEPADPGESERVLTSATPLPHPDSTQARPRAGDFSHLQQDGAELELATPETPSPRAASGISVNGS